MRVRYSPQRSDKNIEYQFFGDVITVTIGSQTDTFDFSGIPDGILQTATTTLPFNPIIGARRTNGVLELELLRFHGQNPSYNELFPEWEEVT